MTPYQVSMLGFAIFGTGIVVACLLGIFIMAAADRIAASVAQRHPGIEPDQPWPRKP